ncbi:MAG: hypothetical protein ACRELF_15185, partial [Gemmataceae bacterium]
MRIASLSRLLLIAALILVAGCSGNKGKIEGTNWLSLTDAVKGQDHSPTTCGLYFGKDGQMVLTIGSRPYKGIYTVGMGQAVTFT